MENIFDNNRILQSVWKWKFHIAIALLIAFIASAVFSGPIFITPKFKSTARVYPVNINEASEESESEHLLEYLQSTDLRFRLIDAFSLDEVYEITKKEKYYQTWILDEYRKHISYKKTDFETVEISVLDEDPFRARDMVDSLINYLNEAIFREKSMKNMEMAMIYKRDLDKKFVEIDSVETIIDDIRKNTGLIDYFAQATTATRGLMDAAANGGNTKPAEQTLDALVEEGGLMRRNLKLLEDFEVAADTLRKRHEKYYSRATGAISYTKVVEHPFVADKKASPIRWLIVVLTVLGTGFISLITVSLIDYIREVKSSL
ncbi:MAG: Wzz/FepE/Etk N-terminal domain-containing protein [Prolixibacteraceae bacterium]|jgi:capsular polysaccharide biosynthesis protein|nr:Wzz/FepE/Etk N-terminal domain-containing protein [Prolixibacteraceae bacterium]